MPIDGFTLSFMKFELENTIVSAKIDKIMQPSKDTLVFNLRTKLGTSKLLISSNPSFARLQITEQKYENPIVAPAFCMLLRKHIQGAKIIGISQISCDRILCIDIEAYTELGDLVVKKLVIEIMGKYSNIIFLDYDGKIIDATRRVNADMSRVRQILPGLSYEFPPLQDKLNPFKMNEKDIINRLENSSCNVKRFLQDNISGLSKTSAEEIVNSLGYDTSDIVDNIDKDFFASSLIDFYSKLQSKFKPNIIYNENNLAIDYFPIKYSEYENINTVYFDTLSKTLDVYYTSRDISDKIRQKSSYLYKIITKHINRCENRIEIINGVESQWNQAQDYKLYGELINANLYKINQTQKGNSKISVENYYDENYGNIDIPLNPELNIIENSNNYFKKYRKAKIAFDLAKKQREEAESEKNSLKQILMDMENAKSDAELDDIKLLLAQNGYIRVENKIKKQMAKSKELRLEHDGIQIYVGKNSIQNDRITLGAKPDDTWLHVQGVPGSHVIVKSSNPSESVLLYAAKLAAYFSTAREQTNITVDYTQKKHVKKPAQSPAGFVRYKNFKSLIINLSEKQRAEFAQII